MKYPTFSELILFEDDDLLVVNKPANMSTLDDRNTFELNLLRLTKKYLEDAQICHRLDKETSGCVIIAKNPETYRSVAMQFEHRQIDKTYHAIVHGNHQMNDLEVNLPILNQGKDNVKIDREGKPALTYFTSLHHFKNFTLVGCKPITGRMHQIRIHLATQRAIIAGDVMYGGQFPMLSTIKRKFRLSKNEEEQPIMKRFALHAYQISFQKNNGEQLTVTAPYPKDFDVFLKLLQKFDA